MANVVVFGSQWGDEGKGKVVDWLSSRADVVVRFQGGHNAGHTLVIDGNVYKLSLLPSGVVRSTLSIIGNGVVVDPEKLLEEIDRLNDQGLNINPSNLRVAENAVLILPLHKQVEKAGESLRSKRIGTTQRGIGPAYEDKVGRRAIRVCDLADESILEEKLDILLDYHSPLIIATGDVPMKKEEIMKRLLDIAPQILQYAEPVWLHLNRLQDDGHKILFEGAQGAMLDIEHGTYPFVTSSNTYPSQAAIGSGIGIQALDYMLGIVKAYTTRVGAGPFPTELFDDVGKQIGEVGKEFGTVTGRQRRCGWFDAVMVRQVLKVSGASGIVLTKMDVLDGLDELKICVGYKHQGITYDYFPSSPKLQAELEPVYETIEGWKCNTASVRNFADLPEKAVNYIKRIEELIEVPVALISTSPEREDMIMQRDPFEG